MEGVTAYVHPVEDGSEPDFYGYNNAPASLVNGGRILELLKKDTELSPASQSVCQCVCMAIDELLLLSQEPSLDHILSQMMEAHALDSILLSSILKLLSR